MNFNKYHVSKNLFDKDNIIDGGDFYVDGTKISASQNTDVLLIPCKPNTYYTVSRSVILGRFAIGFVTSSTLYADMPVSNSRQNDGATYLTSFSDSDSTYLVVYYAKHAGSGSNTETEIQSCLDTLMVNEGSSAESYEPYSSEVWHDIPHYIHNTSTDTLTTLPADIYANDTTATVGLKGQMEQSGTPSPDNPIQPQECGDLETTGEHAGQYKIPILNNSQTTNVYLGEVQSTRRIKKLVLTGEENWSGTSKFRIGLSGQIGTIAPICTHYRGVTTASYADLADGRVTVNGGIGLTLAIYDIANQSSLTAWKSYLAAQYAAGTPVTVWYVLDTPQTAVVNEPLRKIGTYADEVSGITIPTIAGANTLSIGTTLQPSEVTVNYKGWHPVADVHERENGQWD